MRASGAAQARVTRRLTSGRAVPPSITHRGPLTHTHHVQPTPNHARLLNMLSHLPHAVFSRLSDMHFSQSPDLTQVIDRQTTCSDSCFGYAAYRHLRKGLEGGYLPETVRPVYLSHLFSETITSVKFVNVQEDDVVRPPPPRDRVTILVFLTAAHFCRVKSTMRASEHLTRETTLRWCFQRSLIAQTTISMYTHSKNLSSS